MAHRNALRNLHVQVPIGIAPGVIPNTIVDAFARGEILQVLLASLLPGPATLSLGNRVRPLVGLIKQA